MAKIGLLILSNPSKLFHILPAIQQRVLKTLYVHVFSDRQRLLPVSLSNGELVQSPPLLSRTVYGIYSQTTVACNDLDVRVILTGIKDPYRLHIETKKPVEVVIFDKVFNKDEVDQFLNLCVANRTSECGVVTLNYSAKESNTLDRGVKCSCHGGSSVKEDPQKNKMYDNVVLGGTFDRLHPGHKILLSEAVLRCKKKLTVGVTDTPLLRSKKLWELIEPCEDRIQSVRHFLEDVDSTLEYLIVPIQDPYGPTKDDPDLEMIVVSAETYKGGLKVNELRKERKLPILDVVSVDILETQFTEEEDEERKVSSGNYRLRLLGTRLRSPQPRPHLPQWPYIIGLTGGIASGKSSVARRLESLGAAVIDCDSLAHTVYRQGEKCYEMLVQHFGTTVVAPDGEINRKALGAIVFNDKDQLSKLNSLVWPALLERVLAEISRLREGGQRVVVVDAAVLLMAGWQEQCHEVWACIVPEEEAAKRVKERNKLSEADASARVAAQIKNTEVVSHATVVFCTLWSHEYTHRQVLRAWSALQAFFADRSKL